MQYINKQDYLRRNTNTYTSTSTTSIHVLIEMVQEFKQFGCRLGIYNCIFYNCISLNNAAC